MNTLRQISEQVRSSLWFLPTVIVLGLIGLALGLIETESAIDRDALVARWPWLFGAGAEGSRGMLGAIASSMMTVAGVAFSITIVALALASSQYTSRILRNFMRDRANQSVLGVFVGIFGYCLIVLRSIRSKDEVLFVPSLAVLGGMALAFVGVGFLIFFVHHIATSIQASSIIKAAANETLAAVDRLFPDEMGASVGEDAEATLSSRLPKVWFAMPAQRTGYVQAVDAQALLGFAGEQAGVVRMERGIGEFVVEGSPLVSLAGKEPDENAVDKLNAAYAFGRQRTVEQDAASGICQIVDVALKALSPGINDTTTAIICIDYLGAILARLSTRRIASRYRVQNGELRVIARGPTFSSLLADAFDQIRQNAESNPAILIRLLETLTMLAGRNSCPHRGEALIQHTELIAEAAERGIRSAHDRTRIQAARQSFSRSLIESRDGGAKYEERHPAELA